MVDGSPSEFSEPTVSAPLGGVAALFAVFVLSVAGLAFSVVGRAYGPEPADPDHLWQPWPPLADHQSAVGVVSLVAFVVASAGLLAASRAGRLRTLVAARVLVLAALAAWLGMGYRVLTAGVTGANIGGGGVLLLTPLVIVLVAVVEVALAIRARRVGPRR